MSRSDAIALAEQGQLADARQAFEEARDWINVSVMFAREGRYDEALEAALRNIKRDPFKAHAQAMKVCWESGDQDGILEHLTEALKIRPEDPDLRTARAAYRLARKDWGGWEDIEYRPWAKKMREACDEVEEWDGFHSIEGKALLVVFQDGHGDRVMYSRFLRNLWDLKPERIVFYTTPETVRLFAEAYPFCEVVSSETQFGDIDLWIGLSSLGKCRFPITGEPYMKVPEEREREFAGYFETNGRLRVGLVWAGNAKHTQDHTRSKPFSFFEPLLDVPGIDFYSLQFDEHNLDHGGRLRELSIYCRDTADTLAAIKNLDLVIGVDTGMIHFAGALGVPAWCLCFTPIDWRWGLEGKRSYWYDSVEIWRDVWSEALYQMRALLEANAVSVKAEIYYGRAKPHFIAELPSITKVTDCRYGRFEIFTHELWCSRSLEVYGEWSEGEIEIIGDLVNPESVVIEAGASIGSHTVPISRLVKHVMAFEPQKEVFDLLQRNVLGNGCKNVSMIESGLGDVDGLLAYDAPPLDSVSEPGSTRVGTGDHPCRIITIDSLGMKKLDLIKADVEGMELQVLKGALRTIGQFRPLLYLEANHAADRTELYRFVSDLGYRIYLHTILLFNPDNFRGEKLNVFGNWDSKMILCVPRERFDLRGVTKHLQRVRVQ